MAKRGPKGDVYPLVKLKGQTHQLQRAEADGRADEYHTIKDAEALIPKLGIESPPIFSDPTASKEDWRNFVVGSWGGLGILKASDDILVDELCYLLEQSHIMRREGIPTTIINTKGDEVENPKHKVFMKMGDKINKMLTQLGMTPTHRAQVYEEMTSSDRNIAETNAFKRKVRRET